MPWSKKHAHKAGSIACATITVLALLYAGYWFRAAGKAEKLYTGFIRAHSLDPGAVIPPQVSGFPFTITLKSEGGAIKVTDGVLRFKNLHINASPVLHRPTEISARDINLAATRTPVAFNFARFEGLITYRPHTITINDALLVGNSLKIGVKGDLSPQAKPPQLDLIVSLENYEALLADLTRSGFMKPQSAMLLSAGIGAFRDTNGKVNIPLNTQPGGHVFAGPIPLGRLK